MGILDRFRGKAAAPTTAKPEYNGEPVLGVYLKADGTTAPLTAKAGWSAGYANYYGTYSKLQIDSTPQGYAYGYVVSVWANRCIEIRSSIIGRMPHMVVSKRTGKPIPRHPLTVALDRSHQGVLRKIEWSRLIWGETFIWPVQNTFNYFSDLWWLNNLGVSVVQGAGFIQSYSYVPVEGGRPELFKPSQIAFMKTDNPFSDLRGLSPMEAVLLDVGVGKDVAHTLKAWYTNDARPGMLLIPENDLLPGQAQEFTDYWKSNFKGSENAGRMGMLPRNIKEIKEMNRAPNIDDVEIREAVRRDICAGFGVPLSIAGAWDDANYQSAPEQRKSLYEDTIIPECEDIASEINNKLLPFFDDTGNVRFEFDVSKILALMEDTAQKEALLSQRLVSGGLTLNEYRLDIGKEPLPGGDVLYVPSTVIVTPLGKIGQPQQQPAYGIPQDNLITAQPVPNAGNAPPITPPAALQTPEQPKQIPAQVQPSGFQQKAIQNSVSDELNAWEKKAIQGGAKKAAKFVCYQLPAEVQAVIREQLTALPNADKPTIKALFAKARTVLGDVEDVKKKADDFPLATPEEFAAYWHDYDSLMQDAGQAWLHDYMERALSGILNKLTDNFQASDILDELSPFRDELAEQWVGTSDNPGIFTRLILAGAARGNEALNDGVSMKPPGKAIVGVNIDWSLQNQQALDYVRKYVFNLISGLDNTTRERVRTALDEWIQSGNPVADLKRALTDIFKDQARAQLIGTTETTRAYAEGAKERWRQAGVNQARWLTVNDPDVCFTCRELHGQIADVAVGWELNGQIYQPPAHPGCRCYLKPVLRSSADQPANTQQGRASIPTVQGMREPDIGRPGNTQDELTDFLNKSNGPLAQAMRDIDTGLVQLNWDTDQYEVDQERAKLLARQFVVESQNIQYSKDYLVSLAQQEAAANGVQVDASTAEQLYNNHFKVQAQAIQTAAQIGDVPLTEAQQRRLQSAIDGNYLDMVYTTQSSLEGSLANQTKRRVVYGGNTYATEAARRDARREMLDRFGMLDTGN